MNVMAMGVGGLLALVVLVLCIVLPLIGKLSLLLALLIGGLAVARLVS